MKKRTKARATSLEFLYGLEITNQEEKRGKEEFFSLYPEKKNDFSEAIISGVLKNKEEINKIIESHLKNWSLKRLALIDYTILSIGIYELLFLKDAPPCVVINEAIELSKIYSTSESYRIVNGILDKIAKENGI